jgi:hypothetical protein
MDDVHEAARALQIDRRRDKLLGARRVEGPGSQRLAVATIGFLTSTADLLVAENPAAKTLLL